ncbi:hypothetical protein [Actinoplanes sp. NPDC020271]|uniref:hypothetical protein n=1 Tax=Actinoplanes sp. NPDC020271 TaxID=3363896 RepID=UPI0037A0C1B2
MAIIDLGDVSAPDFPEEPPEPARPLTRRGIVRVVAAVLAGACALALNGAGRPAPPAVTETWSTPIGAQNWPHTMNDTVLVIHGDPGTEQETTAYDLVTGQVRWTADDPTLTSWLNPDPDSNQLYAPARIRSYEAADGPAYIGADTRAVDVRTGKVRWDSSGDELAATADEVLLGSRDDRGRVTALHLVRTTDGTAVWDRPIAATDYLVVSEEPGDSTRIVAKSTNGELTTLRWADGVPLASRRVTPPTAYGWGPQVLGGQFYDILTGTPDSTVVAYATDTLTELWRFPTSGETSVQDCGPVVCVSDTHLTSGLDPVTGERRWKLPSGNTTELPGGRLLLTGSRGMADAQSVLDAATGRTIRVAPAGKQVVPLDDGRLLALGDTRSAPYRVTISEWDPDTGRATLIGAVPGRSDTCQAVGQRLLCTGSGRLGVTDLGPRSR